MALFKILHGDEERISLDITPFHEGWCYITHNGRFYVDMNIGTPETPVYARVETTSRSAYQIACVHGFEGTEEDWLESLKGESGVWTGSEEPPEGYDVWIDPNGEVDGATVEFHNVDPLAHADIRTALSNKADRTQALFYIEGDSSSTTDTTNKVATWIGSHDEITEYFDGLTILYKVVTAGSTTTTLNINGLGATAVVRNATTGISTACPVDGILLLTYTVDSSGTAYWKTADYDANTKNTAGTSNKTGTKMYLVGGTSQTSSGTTTYTNSNIYINTSNVLYSAKGFNGDLTGTATKATQDASGNIITSTYETKADATTKINNINTQISQLSSDKDDLIEKVGELEEDIISIQAQSLQQSPLFANSIAECTDQTKLYVLPDGYIYAYMSETGALFTNQIINAVDTDGKPYNNGLGYKTDRYIGASGAEGDAPGYIVTGYIPIKNIQSLVLKVSGYTSALTNNDQMKFYNSSFANIAIDNNDRLDTNVKTYGGTFTDEPAFNNTVKTFTFDYQIFKSKTSYYSGLLANGGVKYVRFSLNSPDLEKMVVTINENIAFGTTSAWQSTGHKFVPADYEEEILALQETAENHESRLKIVEQYGGSGSASSVDIPAYIKAEAEDVMSRLITKQENRVFNMIAMSDFHYSNYAEKYGGEEDENRVTLKSVAKATSYMLDRIHIDAIATLGDNTPFGAVTASDIEWGHKWHKEINEILSITQRPGVVDFRTVGNHDRMGGTDANGTVTPIMPDGAIYQYIQGYNRQCDYLSAPVGYGYKDFEGYKLRVIVLNTAECEGKGRFSEPYHGFFIGNAQYNWLINKALDMSDKDDASEWQILILSHHRADDAQVATDGHSWQKNAFILPNILNAYKTGGSYSGAIASEGISVSCNFAGKNQARLIGMIHGHHHNHKYFNLYLGPSDNSTQTTIMAVGTPTTSYGTTNPDNNGISYTSSALGTADETTFSVYAIDLDEHKIYSINYGKGIDREINY